MDHRVVSHEQWLSERKELLIKEKAFTRQRDEMTAAQRALPWEKVEKPYVFEGSNGEVSLQELFDGRSQLVVYHFMFGPDWEAGCPSCSFWADSFDRVIVHLNQRDISMVAVSRTDIAKLQSYKERLGWSFTWVSSLGNDFNWDYDVSFTQEQLDGGEGNYNYGPMNFPMEEGPGLSVFYKDDSGQVFHTYSCFARGLDILNSTYHYMDLVPKGRDESGLEFTMAWVRRHDEY